MRRLGGFLRSARKETVTAAAATSTAQTAKAPPSRPAVAAKPITAFQALHIQPWQQRVLGERSGELPSNLYYHGKQLGPRPLLILDAATKTPEEALRAAARFEGMLSQLSWDDGSIYVPLRVDSGESPSSEVDVLGRLYRQVTAVLDVLNVRWTHVLGHSLGGLVAARMATSSDALHRIGTMVLLDTPLVTPAMVLRDEQRREILAAEQDVNVPVADLTFAKENLLGALEEPLPVADELFPYDKAFYDGYLFNPAHVFDRGGLVRRNDRYLSIKDLRSIRHPTQVIHPVTGGIADVSIHKSVLGLRRTGTVQSAKSHSDLFTAESAVEIGMVLEQWIHRFDPDYIIKKRFEQAATEMAQLMGGADAATGKDAAAGGASVAGGAGGKGRKEKKKK